MLGPLFTRSKDPAPAAPAAAEPPATPAANEPPTIVGKAVQWRERYLPQRAAKATQSTTTPTAVLAVVPSSTTQQEDGSIDEPSRSTVSNATADDPSKGTSRSNWRRKTCELTVAGTEASAASPSAASVCKAAAPAEAPFLPAIAEPVRKPQKKPQLGYFQRKQQQKKVAAAVQAVSKLDEALTRLHERRGSTRIRGREGASSPAREPTKEAEEAKDVLAAIKAVRETFAKVSKELPLPGEGEGANEVAAADEGVAAAAEGAAAPAAVASATAPSTAPYATVLDAERGVRALALALHCWEMEWWAASKHGADVSTRASDCLLITRRPPWSPLEYPPVFMAS